MNASALAFKAAWTTYHRIWVACLLAAFLGLVVPHSVRAQGSIDLDGDGQAEFHFYIEQGQSSMNWDGSYEYYFDWKLVSVGTNSVWCYAGTASPMFYPKPGAVWSETNSPAGYWSAPGIGFLLERFGRRTFNQLSSNVFRYGALASDQVDGIANTYMIVRFGTPSGWRLAWMDWPTFKPFAAHESTLFPPPVPFEPAWIDVRDIGVHPGPAPQHLTIGTKVPGREQKLKISVQGKSSTTLSLMLTTYGEGLGDMIEWSPHPVDGPWTELMRVPRGVSVPTAGMYGLPYLDAIYFRLK
jgi:hypothetical protein